MKRKTEKRSGRLLTTPCYASYMLMQLAVNFKPHICQRSSLLEVLRLSAREGKHSQLIDSAVRHSSALCLYRNGTRLRFTSHQQILFPPRCQGFLALGVRAKAAAGRQCAHILSPPDPDTNDSILSSSPPLIARCLCCPAQSCRKQSRPLFRLGDGASSSDPAPLRTIGTTTHLRRNG